MRPGNGDFPVGQVDAQNLLPNGRGIPSFASSVRRVQLSDRLTGMERIWKRDEPWLTRELVNVTVKTF